MARALEIVETRDDNMRILALTGRLDTNTSAQLDAASKRIWEEGYDASVVLELEGCTFVSSAGLRVIVSMQKRAMVGGGSLIIRGATPNVKDVFASTGIDRILTIE